MIKDKKGATTRAKAKPKKAPSVENDSEDIDLEPSEESSMEPIPKKKGKKVTVKDLILPAKNGCVEGPDGDPPTNQIREMVDKLNKEQL